MKIAVSILTIVVLIGAVTGVLYFHWQSQQDDHSERDGSDPASQTQTASPETQPVVQPITTSQGSWPCFGGSHSFRGLAEGRLGTNFAVAWKFKTGGAVVSFPVVDAKRVYAGADDGKLYAIDRQTGKKAWELVVGDAILGTPCLYEGMLYVASSDTRVMAVDPDTGKPKWTHYPRRMRGKTYVLDRQTGKLTSAETSAEKNAKSPKTQHAPGGSEFIAVPENMTRIVDAGTGEARLHPAEIGGDMKGAVNAAPTPTDKVRVFLSSYDHKVYALDGETGKKVWSVEADDRINQGSAVHDGKIIFGGCDAMLHLVQIEDGKELEGVLLDSYVPGAPAVADGVAYIGTYEMTFSAVDLKTGELLWDFFDADGEYFQAGAVGKDHVVVGNDDYSVYCLSRKDGKKLWSFPTRDKIGSTPVICHDKVVVGAGDGNLYVLSLKDGKKIWSYEIGDSASSPAVVDGNIYVGAMDGYLYAFRPN
ncbi:MAG: PQQ-binding-like beta-propeller repeat protein [Phycisphaerae bacterium]